MKRKEGREGRRRDAWVFLQHCSAFCLWGTPVIGWGGLHRCLNPAWFAGLEKRLQSTGSVKWTIVTILKKREGGWEGDRERVSGRRVGWRKREMDSFESTWGFVWDNLFAFYPQSHFVGWRKAYLCVSGAQTVAQGSLAGETPPPSGPCELNHLSSAPPNCS